MRIRKLFDADTLSTRNASKSGLKTSPLPDETVPTAEDFTDQSSLQLDSQISVKNRE
jgi:hypothetical protein